MIFQIGKQKLTMKWLNLLGGSASFVFLELAEERKKKINFVLNVHLIFSVESDKAS